MGQLDSIVNITILLAAALVGGMLAHRLKQPVVLGYILIGVVIGPYALGLVDDVELVQITATIGVALLMFTLGLEISLSQLRQVGRIGVWGGILQIVLTLVLGAIIGILLFKWTIPQSILFGLIISLSSTAICFKVLMDRGEQSSIQGRIMIGMLILQDVSVVLMIVILPLLSGIQENLVLDLGLAIVKAVFFVGLAVVLGRWVLPWLMGNIGGVRARELFLLTVIVLSLGAAIGTQIFGLSMVFGAFLVGLVLRETKFVHQAIAEITPLRDIFATLFFVSLGMLLDPFFFIRNWQLVLLTVAIIICLKFIVVFGIVRFFGYSFRIALLTGVGLFQIGEFGFVLAQGGLSSGIVSNEFDSLIVASAVLTMLFTPMFFSLSSWIYQRKIIDRKGGRVFNADQLYGTEDGANNMTVIAGYGRVGQNIAQGLRDAGISFVIIDIDPERIAKAEVNEIVSIYGDATNLHVLSQAGLHKSKALVITYPDPLAVIATARISLNINPKLQILSRVHRRGEVAVLKKMGVTELISPEYEASFRFIKELLKIYEFSGETRKEILAILRRDEKIAKFNPDQ